MEEGMSREAVLAFFARDRFAAHVGIELVEAGGGAARARLPLDERHLNGLGMVHGAALFALADLAFAAAVNSRGRAAVAIHCTIAYLKAPREGCLTAEAREVSCGPKLALYQIDIADEGGERVARFEGMAYRKKERWSP